MSYQTYNKALEDMNNKERALGVQKNNMAMLPNIASLEKRTNDALAKHTQKKIEETNYTRDLNTAKSLLSAAQTAKTKDAKKIKELQTKVDNVNAKLQRVRQEITVLWNEYQKAKTEFDNAKRQHAAEQQKLTLAQNAYNAAVKKVDAERPWYVKAGNALYNAMDSTITYGKKVFNMTDWDLMEKAVTAAGKAVGIMKEPPEKIVKALDTMGKYLGYINTSISVNDAIGSLKELIAAGQRYSKASSDSQKIDAVSAISISTLNTIEKTLGIKGGIISSVASVGSLFCTALIKSVAATCRLAQNRNYNTQLLSEVTEKDRDGSIHTAAVQASCCELALKMLQDNKTDKEIWEGIEAYKTLKAA